MWQIGKKQNCKKLLVWKNYKRLWDLALIKCKLELRQYEKR